MGGVFAGFATITVVIGVGVLVAHLGLVDGPGQRTLSALAFYVASPALLFTTVGDSDVGALFSGNLVALAGAVLVTVLVNLAVGLAQRRDLGSAVVTSMCSAYGNGANLGLPIAFYVLGDAALVAPLLLLQLLVIQPLALTVLDVAVSPTRLSLGRILARPVTNPITVGSVLGLVVATTGVEVPALVLDPVELIGAMAVPVMLLAYGVALRLGPLPGRGVPVGELGLAVGLKLVVQPLAAYLIGLLIGLDGAALLAVTVISALPTAQNVFVIAQRYDRAALLARDAIFVSTVACVPVVVVVVAALG